MMIDNLTGSLICYGFSLSCSLDALVYFPFLIYRVLIKVTKQMYRQMENDNHNQMYQDNELNLDLLKNFLIVLHEAAVALAAGFILPWIPYIYHVGLFKGPNHGEINFFYDHVKNNIYGNSIINPNN